jgi:hypothetical protein
MRVHFCDRTNTKLTPEETTTLKISGPLASMIGRREIHIGKPESIAVARWLGFDLARPDVATVPGPEPVRAEAG